MLNKVKSTYCRDLIKGDIMNNFCINNYKIEVINDSCYTSNSKDNTCTYQFEHGDKDDKQRSNGSHLYGLRLYIVESEYSSAILFGSGWAGSFSDRLICIRNSEVVILAGNSVFCLELPNLNLKWKTDGQWITGFQIYKIHNGYVVHGELSIGKVSYEGNLEWEFYGRDIFILPSGEDNFIVRHHWIEVADWEGYKYKITFSGKEIRD